MGKYRKLPVVIEAFQLTYEMAKGELAVPLWFAEATRKNEVKVFLTDKIHNSQHCEIKTLEGVMTGNAKDYIIQGVKGEIYPCKPEIFEATYELVKTKKSTLNFGEAIESLKAGKLVSRQGWNGKGMFIVKQIPAVIGIDIIPRMTSLPQSVKDVFLERNHDICYESQMLIINSSGRADSWVPSSSDVFAEDWVIFEQ